MSDLEPQQRHDFLSIDLEYLRFCLSINKMLLFTCVVATVSLTSVYFTFFRVETFKAEVALRVAATAPSSALSSLLASLNSSENAAAKLEALNELLGSSEFSEALVDRAQHNEAFFNEYTRSVHLTPEYRIEPRGPSDSEHPMGELTDEFKDRLVHSMTDNLQFKPDQRASVLSVTAHARDPILAVELAELAGDSIVDLNYKRKLAEITSLKKFLMKQLEDNGDKLNTFEAQLAQLQRFHGLLNDAAVGNPTVVRYTKVQEEIEEIKRLMAANNDRIRIHEHDLSEFRASLTDPASYKSNVYLTQLQYRMRTLAYELDLAKSTYSGTAEDGETIKRELDSLGKTYRDALDKASQGKALPVASPTQYFQEMEKDLRSLKKEKVLLASRYQRAQDDLKTAKQDADLLPEQMRDYESLKRKITLTSTIYLDTEKKLQEVRFMEAETVNDLSVLFRAKAPKEPDNLPMSRLFFMMAVVGIFVGFLLIMWMEIFNTVIRSKKDMERKCDQFLGSVPRMTIAGPALDSFELKPALRLIKNSILSKRGIANSLILEEFPDGQDADNFRSLRMHLLKLVREDAAFSQGQCKVIMVTSPKSHSGRTFLSANLALTLAKADLKVLLVDLDLRKPELHEFFPKTTPMDGGSNFSAAELKRNIQKHSNHLDVLVLKGRTSHPPEVLESHEVQSFFKDVRESYDFVIFDSPAVLNSVDPSIASAMADLVVMAVESQRTKRDEFIGAVRRIRSGTNRPIYGVLNFSDRRRDAVA